MRSPKLQLTDLQDTKLREALDELKDAKQTVHIASKHLIFAADQGDDLITARKLCNHAAGLDAIYNDLNKAIEQITERIAGVYTAE